MNSRIFVFMWGVFVGFASPTLAQNWQPINSNDHYHYVLNDSLCEFYNEAFTNALVIRVDSVQLQGGDSVFFLNRVVNPYFTTRKKNDYDYERRWAYPERTVTNQPLFLNRIVRITADGDRVQFESPRNEMLLPFAQLGESWMFDEESQIQAEVIEIGTQEIFGQLDSVKTIQLSNGRTIRLSKNFGLLEFPFRVYEDNMEDYRLYPPSLQLVGMRGRNVGAYLPNFQDFYDWEVGNNFIIKFFGNYGLGRNPDIRTCFRVVEKYVVGDTFRYVVEGVKYDRSNINNQQGSINEIEEFSDELVFIDSSDHHLNRYNHEFRCEDGIIPYYFQGTDGTIFQGYTVADQAHKSRLDITYICSTIVQPDREMWCGDCLFTVTNPVAYSNEAAFAPGRGRVLEIIRQGSYSNEELIDFQEAGIHEQCEWPGTNVDILPSIDPVLEFRLSPNPTAGMVYLEVPVNLGEGWLEFIDPMGKIVKGIPVDGQRTQVNVANLPAGCYYVRVFSLRQIRYQSMLIINR